MSTGARNIETPTGPAVGSIFARMDILGVSSFLTQTGNRTNDKQQWEEIVDIDVPVGTHAVVVSTDYWALGFGSMTGLLDPLDPNSNVSVAVTDVNASVFIRAPP